MAIATPNDFGGFEYKFVDITQDRYVCNICHLPSRDPYLSVCCGQVFCKSCLDSVKKASTVTNACPICRDEEFVTFPNKQLDREVKSLHVMCTNNDKGCEWQGELNDINNHLGNSDGCQFEGVKCSNECGNMLQRQYLFSHVETECPLRKVDCQYCHITGEHQFIKGEHKEQCPKLPLLCPNKCEVGNVPREDMEAHRKECPLEVVQCEYHNVGCEEKMMRKDVEKHEHDCLREHLCFTKSELAAVKEELSSELADTKSQLATALEQINTLMTLMNSQQHIAVSLCASNKVSATEATSPELKWLDRLFSVTAITKSNDQMCPVTVNLAEYNKIRQDQLIWYSKPFYSHEHGYKMCLKVNPGGDGKSTHMSVFLHLMKGPHDDELTWPLRKTFEFKLLNQISDSEHYSKRATFDNSHRDGSSCRVTEGEKAKTGIGFNRFASPYKVTSTCRYLKNDCIFIQVVKL